MFFNLVQGLASLIEKLEMTPSEVREAAILAAFIAEERNPIPRVVIPPSVSEALETLAEFRKRYP